MDEWEGAVESRRKVWMKWQTSKKEENLSTFETARRTASKKKGVVADQKKKIV